jgi:hypothetical protein
MQSLADCSYKINPFLRALLFISNGVQALFSAWCGQMSSCVHISRGFSGLNAAPLSSGADLLGGGEGRYDSLVNSMGITDTRGALC